MWLACENAPAILLLDGFFRDGIVETLTQAGVSNRRQGPDTIQPDTSKITYPLTANSLQGTPACYLPSGACHELTSTMVVWIIQFEVDHIPAAASPAGCV